MALLETLALAVGPAIAKSILKIWLKDSDIALSTTSSLVDVLSSKTKDVIARQHGKRQFEEIGEKVATSLQLLFKEARLEENEQVAVAQAVADTLNKTPISPELLIHQDLDPSELADFLIKAHPQIIRDFTEDETSLYKRVINEVARDIVDIASQLPSFQERTFGEVLKRENQLIARADQILIEVRRIREETRQANPEVAAAHFEEEYKRAIIRKLDEMELFGADVSTASRRHRLSVAYVSLSVEKEITGEVETSTSSEDVETTSVIKTVSVDEALAKAHRLIVRGSAGSGKTTLLKWVAVQAASGGFVGALEPWNGMIPFFIRLRQCVETGLPTPEDFPGLIVPAIAGTMPSPDWVHSQLRSGRAIVLVDGVDEVPQSQRLEVRSWLKELVETNEQAKFIVSSRPNAIEDDWMAPQGFDEAELQPMELADINQFIVHWHQAVREELQDPEKITALEDLSSHLKEVIRQNRPLRNLAETPVLCSMICAIHRDRNRQLPADRIQLYEACCLMLLEQRDIQRRIELRSDYPSLSYSQKRKLLEDLAYWMIRNGYTWITAEQADERLALKLERMIGLQELSPTKVRRLFIDRTGMIQEPTVDEINFTHRTFQEFLAANAALDEGDTGLLCENAHNDQWREVIVSAAGLAPKKGREDLINGLMARGDQEADLRYQLHLLAVACLETATELAPEVQQQVKMRLADLVPPKNMTDAKALASAGELAVPFLADGVKERSIVAAACVRTLSLIGNEAALSALERFKQDTRQAVQRELVKARSAFQFEEFDLRILSKVDLSRADLSRADLSGADLSGVNLRGANLSRADLSGADLSGADLKGANLFRAKIDDTTRIDQKWQLVWEIVNKDISHRALSGTDLSGADLFEANLFGADLSEANLSAANLGGANLAEANLVGANLVGANLSRAYLFKTVIDKTTRIDQKWQLVWEIVNKAVFRRTLIRANLVGANLSGAYLEEANLSGAYLSGADLIESNLSRADLSGANLRWADLSGADLRWADLSGADLSRANLRGANLSGADLVEANLVEANLVEAHLSGANLVEAHLNGSTLFRTNLIRANLSGADLSGAILRDANLSETVLVGANLIRANMRRADLRGAKYNDATKWSKDFNPKEAGATKVD